MGCLDFVVGGWGGLWFVVCGWVCVGDGFCWDCLLVGVFILSVC